MTASRALARITRFTTREALPFARLGMARLRGTMDDYAIRLLGSDFEDRLNRVAETLDDGRMDAFGLDLETAKYVVAGAAFLHRVYFRTEARGQDRVPEGRVLLVANHSGQLPIDGLLIGATMFLDAEPPRLIRSMVEKWTATIPFVGTFFQRVGQVVGVPENARRLLEHGEALVVFPEGAKGISKPFWKRYELTEFGLGFMRLALETGTPIVPIAVIGGEEQYINVGNAKRLAKLLQMPSFPVVPQWFVPGAQLPLPTKYRIHFGEPLYFTGDPDDEDAVIDTKVAIVRRTIQSMVNRGLKERTGIFF
ncbi:MAG: acyltransferase family protein [Deltaproteobacteria bacterium]|jgi:1-acyl-sn-glycerol-3-phosphate acyltransferase|nr:acyltransferase family protein [Deltaproteobacteria bacterium]MBW2534988.1 acyltransferase family protein [Deltaproteobacteria bacterium]